MRGADVFVVQPTCTPVEPPHHGTAVHDPRAQALLGGADHGSVTLLWIRRQDRKDKPRVPISAKLVATLIEAAGADRVLALDLHAAQIQGFFDIPVDHLFGTPVMIDYFKPLEIRNLTVVSPDAGGVERARAFAKRLNAPLAIIDKRREEANVAEVMNVIGKVKDRNCLMVDDLIDTAGTLVKGAKALFEHGAASVSACATHAVLVGPGGRAHCESRNLKEVVVTNSIPLVEEGQAVRQDQNVVGCAFAGEGGAVDSRGDFSQYFVCLDFRVLQPT